MQERAISHLVLVWHKPAIHRPIILKIAESDVFPNPEDKRTSLADYDGSGELDNAGLQFLVRQDKLGAATISEEQYAAQMCSLIVR